MRQNFPSKLQRESAANVANEALLLGQLEKEVGASWSDDLAQFSVVRKFIQRDRLHRSHFKKNFSSQILLLGRNSYALNLQVGRLETALEKDGTFPLAPQCFSYRGFKRIGTIWLRSISFPINARNREFNS